MSSEVTLNNNIPNTENMPYVFTVGSFHGPLDLLLNLIEERKLFINEISLSLITEDYITHVNKIKDTGIKLEKYYEITGYLVIIATLLLIKSRSLLPNFEITVDEKITIEDLEDRLKLYKIYKDLVKDIESIYGKNNLRMKVPKKIDVLFIPDIQITRNTLHSLVKGVLENVPLMEKVKENPDVFIKTSITIETVMERISKTIEEMKNFSFKQFTSRNQVISSTKEEKIFTVISFLAILELIRTGVLHTEQEEAFSDFEIIRNIEKIHG